MFFLFSVELFEVIIHAQTLLDKIFKISVTLMMFKHCQNISKKVGNLVTYDENNFRWNLHFMMNLRSVSKISV